MKRVFFLCLLFALGGALLAIAVTRPPAFLASSIAQEPFVPSAVPTPPPAVPSARLQTGPTPSGPQYPNAVTGPVIAPPYPTAAAAGVPVADDLTPEERVNVAVYENVNKSVVNIETKGYRGDRVFMIEVPSSGEGSGSVINQEGHILTNYHVIEGADRITVTLFDGKEYNARPVGQDPVSDVAIIKIDAPAESLFPVTFGDSSRLRVGQRVFAIGNPFGLERTLSTGIIASLNRTLPSRLRSRSVKEVIQIDAAINPGNSGGPLLDSHSRVIGMNWAIASKTGESAGVGFAIPINTIARVVPQLIKNGHVSRPDVGIAKVYQTDDGLMIYLLIPGGPAEQAGLRGPRKYIQHRRSPFGSSDYTVADRSAADTIVAVDGQSTKTVDDFLTAIESKSPGAQVMITVIRQGRQVNVPVRLGGGEQ
jgi:S1-C subfamily serine protease